jgi:hypothetical protein
MTGCLPYGITSQRRLALLWALLRYKYIRKNSATSRDWWAPCLGCGDDWPSSVFTARSAPVIAACRPGVPGKPLISRIDGSL